MDPDIESILRVIKEPSFLKRNKYFIIGLIFIIFNLISINLIFNNPFFNTLDKSMLNAKFILIFSGLSILPFVILLKFIKSLSFTKLILIFFIFRIGFFCFFVISAYGVEVELNTVWLDMVTRVLNGNLADPYSPFLQNDLWRMSPPIFMWWYVYNYFTHNLNPFFWRLITMILEIGIIYAMFSLFEQTTNSNNESNNDRTKEFFKIGFLFYTFSIFSLVFVVLYANAHVLAIVLGFFGLIYYYGSKNSTKHLYYSIAFLTISALIQYLAFILVFSIILIVIFQKQYNKLIFLILEILVIFCLACFPLLMNDSLGFFQRIFSHYMINENSWNLSIWLFSDQVVKLIPILFILALILYYTYSKINEIGSLEYFTIILSIGIIFAPVLNFWNYLWILPLISINLMYSFRKYLITNLFFLISQFLFLLMFAISAMLYPSSLDPNLHVAFIQILDFGESISLAGIFRFIGIPLFQIGLIYLIYSYTKSKKFIFLIIFPFNIFYFSNLLIWLGTLFY